MGIDLQHREVRMALFGRPDGAHAHRMFPTKKSHHLPFVHEMTGALIHRLHHRIGAGKVELRRIGVDAGGVGFHATHRVVKFQTVRRFDDGLWALVGAFHKRAGAVVGDRYQNIFCSRLLCKFLVHIKEIGGLFGHFLHTGKFDAAKIRQICLTAPKLPVLSVRAGCLTRRGNGKCRNSRQQADICHCSCRSSLDGCCGCGTAMCPPCHIPCTRSR